MARYLILFCFSIFLAGCARPAPAQVAAVDTQTAIPAPTPTCPDRAAAFMRLSHALRLEWDDAVTLADSTPRSSLSPQIAELQRIRRETDALDVPDCAVAAKRHLVAAMDAGIDGFLAFLVKKDDYEQYKIDAKFDELATELAAYQNELADMSGVPRQPTAVPTSIPTPRSRSVSTTMPSSEPSIILSTDRGQVGTMVDVIGRDWPANASIAIWFSPNPDEADTRGLIQTDEFGYFDATISVPTTIRGMNVKPGRNSTIGASTEDNTFLTEAPYEVLP